MPGLPSTPVDGRTRVQWVPAIANTGAPTVLEANATSGFDASCYITADGWAPGTDEATISDDRFCDVETFERRGRVTNTLSTTYIENPTDAANNKMAVTLATGTLGFFLIRRGLAFDTAFAAGQKVDVWPVESGIQTEVAPEANSVYRLTQKQFIRDRVRRQVALV